MCKFSGLQSCVAVIEKVPQIPHKLLTAIGTIAPDKVSSTVIREPVPSPIPQTGQVVSVATQSSPSSTSEPVFTVLGEPPTAKVKVPVSNAPCSTSDSILPKRSQREQIKDKIYEDRLLRWMNVDIEPARSIPAPTLPTPDADKKQVMFRQNFIPFKFEMAATPTCTCARPGLPGDITTLYQTMWHVRGRS